MIDNATAWCLKFVKENGLHGTVFIILGILFPLVTVAVSVGYGIWWGILHVLMFVVFVACVFFGPMRLPRRIRPALWISGGLASVVFLMGILDATKPAAVAFGLVLSQIGLWFLALTTSGFVLGYGGIVAAVSDEKIEDAEERGVETFDYFLAAAAWECFGACYFVSLGQYLSLFATALLLSASGFIIYGSIVWKFAGKVGKETVYYGAVALCIGVTVNAVYHMLLGESATWNVFLKTAVDIRGHTLEWFVGVAIALAIGYILSNITGVKAIRENTTIATCATAGIFFLAWVGWFGGYQSILNGLTRFGTADLPSQEVWHGVIRLIILGITIPTLVHHFWEGGFPWLAKTLLWMVPCVYMPWFLFEAYLWEWYPHLHGSLGEWIYGLLDKL